MGWRSLWWSARLAWWFGLWRLRPVGRLFLARSGLAAVAVSLRSLWHWLFANAFTVCVKVVLVLAGMYDLLPWPLTELDIAVGLVVALSGALFVLYHLATSGGRVSARIMSFRSARVLFGWKLGWALRSRWPMEWATAAAKTRAVQAEVGTTAEASVTIRPVFDAPKLSWWPQVEWPAISWWVSPPPGRTFEQFDTLLEVLASNIPNAVDIHLEYERATSSIGRLSILFDDPLADPILPVSPLAERSDAVAEVIDLDELRPRLRGDREG